VQNSVTTGERFDSSPSEKSASKSTIRESNKAIREVTTCAEVAANETAFNEWYLAYPKHVAKGRARKLYHRIVQLGSATTEELQLGAERYALQRAGKDDQYTKHPATWLNDECWKDEAAPSPFGAVGAHASTAAGIMKALRGRSLDDQVTEAAAAVGCGRASEDQMKSAKVIELPVEATRHGAHAAYPHVSQLEQLERRLRTAMAASGELKVAMQSNVVERLSAAIDDAKRLIVSGEIAALQGELPSALAPATLEEIGARIALLIKSFPQRGKDDLETYAQLLIEDVGAESPTRLGLEIACRRLRRSVEWLPKISQVLETLKKTEAWIRHAPNSLERLPKFVSEARASLATERRWRERDEACTPSAGTLARDDVGPRLQALADELREHSQWPIRRPPSGPAPNSHAVAAALAGLRGAAESAALTAKEAMAKHRSQQAIHTGSGQRDELRSIGDLPIVAGDANRTATDGASETSTPK
jgi:hypothetical protein